MKYIAVFLASCILFLSSVSGMANTLHRQVSASCCKEGSHKNHCGDQKNIPCNDCAKGACNTMLSCGTCGFLVISPLAVSPIFSYLNNQTAHPFITGELSDYQDNGWNPPKA